MSLEPAYKTSITSAVRMFASYPAYSGARAKKFRAREKVPRVSTSSGGSRRS